uniref:AAA+ ATPase domain-containing protein n=1 Tax=Chromera velia CCMP2878 TaxID=1169474 RepID=A0A0G4HLC7_9ALVE|eukprot:Cvel_7352.t1-p1 / transcript=Cvel_7352.t1 / gene=Cvel_7352 / organism=Chromera_velia_CCMP2878 / gene_product=Probable helicase MAGATAMA 3, putative / transcript_product=Probable helicase MAGATAMA 3, putative / location=Cvel_scaffold381:77693-85050(+) / protein_length=1346 / sequence_SO=supercontig / SO=protein_coding / is_pseudo=false
MKPSIRSRIWKSTLRPFSRIVTPLRSEPVPALPAKFRPSGLTSYALVEEARFDFTPSPVPFPSPSALPSPSPHQWMPAEYEEDNLSKITAPEQSSSSSSVAPEDDGVPLLEWELRLERLASSVLQTGARERLLDFVREVRLRAFSSPLTQKNGETVSASSSWRCFTHLRQLAALEQHQSILAAFEETGSESFYRGSQSAQGGEEGGEISDGMEGWALVSLQVKTERQKGPLCFSHLQGDTGASSLLSSNDSLLKMHDVLALAPARPSVDQEAPRETVSEVTAGESVGFEEGGPRPPRVFLGTVNGLFVDGERVPVISAGAPEDRHVEVSLFPLGDLLGASSEEIRRGLRGTFGSASLEGGEVKVKSIGASFASYRRIVAALRSFFVEGMATPPESLWQSRVVDLSAGREGAGKAKQKKPGMISPEIQSQLPHLAAVLGLPKAKGQKGRKSSEKWHRDRIRERLPPWTLSLQKTPFFFSPEGAALLVEALKYGASVRAENEKEKIGGNEFRPLCSVDPYTEHQAKAAVVDVPLTLSPDQLDAAVAAVRSPLCLIQGPPGTGKTRTAAAIVDALARLEEIEEGRVDSRRSMHEEEDLNPPRKILATADSNVAADNLFWAIAQAGRAVVRVGANTGLATSSPPHSAGASARSEREVSLLELRGCGGDSEGPPRSPEGSSEPLSLSPSSLSGSPGAFVFVPSQREGESGFGNLGAQSGSVVWEPNVLDSLQRASVVVATCAGSGGGELDGVCFDRVVIDECTQSPLTSSFVALARGATQVILVGDQKQLPPTVLATEARGGEFGLGQSLYHRLLKSQLRRRERGEDIKSVPVASLGHRGRKEEAEGEGLESSQSLSTCDADTEVSGNIGPEEEEGGGVGNAGGVQRIRLDIQRRAHPSLAAFSSALFYNLSLGHEPWEHTTHRPAIRGFPWPSIPLDNPLLCKGDENDDLEGLVETTFPPHDLDTLRVMFVHVGPAPAPYKINETETEVFLRPLDEVTSLPLKGPVLPPELKPGYPHHWLVREVRQTANRLCRRANQLREELRKGSGRNATGVGEQQGSSNGGARRRAESFQRQRTQADKEEEREEDGLNEVEGHDEGLEMEEEVVEMEETEGESGLRAFEEKRGTSFCNVEEARAVVGLLSVALGRNALSHLREGKDGELYGWETVDLGEPVHASEICVVCPYTAQAELVSSLIKTELGPEAHRSISVSTIDGFQGREKDLIVLSLVRSNGEGSRGFLRDPRRANVALTRARRGMLVVGDAGTFGATAVLSRLTRSIQQEGGGKAKTHGGRSRPFRPSDLTWPVLFDWLESRNAVLDWSIVSPSPLSESGSEARSTSSQTSINTTGAQT